jgi:hypothetical protein
LTAIGAARELPDDTVVKVPLDVSPEELATTIVGLLRSPGRRDTLARRGVELVRAQSFDRTAQVLYERYIEPAGRT